VTRRSGLLSVAPDDVVERGWALMIRQDQSCDDDHGDYEQDGRPNCQPGPLFSATFYATARLVVGCSALLGLQTSLGAKSLLRPHALTSLEGGRPWDRRVRRPRASRAFATSRSRGGHGRRVGRSSPGSVRRSAASAAPPTWFPPRGRPSNPRRGGEDGRPGSVVGAGRVARRRAGIGALA
jgi:hypothetical protein